MELSTLDLLAAAWRHFVSRTGGEFSILNNLDLASTLHKVAPRVSSDIGVLHG